MKKHSYSRILRNLIFVFGIIIFSNINSTAQIYVEEQTCICEGGFASIDIAVEGDAGPFNYQWIGPSGFSSDEEDITNLTDPGIYNVLITNNTGCVEELFINILECDFAFDDFELNVSNDCNSNGGKIEVKVPSNIDISSPYIFHWLNIDGTDLSGSNIITDENIGYSAAYGLDEGEYCVIVIAPDNGCATQSCFSIESFEEPNITYEITPESSAGNDGAINLTVEGSSSPFTFNWSNGAITQNISSLESGTYEVEIGYGDGCSKTLSIDLLSCMDLEQEINLETVVTPVWFTNPASIDLIVEGGENYSFQFFWQNSQTGETWETEDIEGLDPGTYCVTVTNQTCNINVNQCVEICDFGLTMVYTGYGCESADVIAQVANGSGPFSYEWSDETTTANHTLAYGEGYCVTVTDNVNCSMKICTTPEFPSIELTYNVVGATLGSSNGAISIEVIGGAAPYTYAWSNGSVESSISGIASGDYTVTVVDDCGNELIQTINVGCEIGQGQVNANITNASCISGTFASIDLTVLGTNVEDNFFVWNNGAVTEDLSEIGAGEYCVTIFNEPSSCEY